MAWQPPAGDAVQSTGWQPPASDAVDQPDNRRWDQKLSDFVTDNTPSYPSGPDMSPIQPQGSGPVSMALSAAGQTVGVQPTTARTPQGAAFETIQNQVMAPARLSNTAGAAVEPTENATVDYLGKKNVNPYLSAGLGMVAGAATDLRNYIPLHGENAALKSELPVIQGSKTGTPHAAFDYNDPITGKSSYQIFGDPVQHGYSTTPNVLYETLQQKGIPVVGKTQKAAQLGHEPLDTLPRQATPQPGFFAKRAGVSFQNPNELPLDVAQARETRTGVPARNFQRLYKDPGAIFSGGNVKEAGANIGAAKEAAGINPGVTNDLSSLTPENIDRINPTKAMKIDDINSVVEKITNGQTPTPQEAQNALDGVNSILSQPSIQNNRDMFRQWSTIKTHINDSLEQAAPDVRVANAAYAREKLGESFSGSDAVNKSGKPSKIAAVAKQIPGVVGGYVGGQLFGTPGAVGGYKLGEWLGSSYHSPFVAGLQTAAESVANKGLSSVEKILSSPAGQAYLARYIQSKSSQGQKQ